MIQIEDIKLANFYIYCYKAEEYKTLMSLLNKKGYCWRYSDSLPIPSTNLNLPVFIHVWASYKEITYVRSLKYFINPEDIISCMIYDCADFLAEGQ